MKPAINIYCQPTPLMFSTSAGAPVVVQTDEAGRVQSDEVGNVLTPDAPIITVQGDENSKSLTDENGAPNIPGA